jgi:hypothetical protein
MGEGAKVPARKEARKIRASIRKYGFMVRSNIPARFIAISSGNFFTAKR